MKLQLKPGDLITFVWTTPTNKIETGIGYVESCNSGAVWLVGGSLASGGVITLNIETLDYYELVTKVNDSVVMSKTRIEKLMRVTELYSNEINKVLAWEPTLPTPVYYWKWVSRYNKMLKLLESILKQKTGSV